MMDFVKALPFAEMDQDLSGRNMRTQIALRDGGSMFTNWMGTPYNPDTLVTTKGGLQVYDRMRLDDQAHAALSFKKMAVTSAGYTIQSPDGKDEDWEVAEFVRQQIEALPGTFERTLHGILSALDYGYSVTEKTYEDRDGQLALCHLRTKYPHAFDFETDQFGTLKPDGLLQGGVMRSQGVPERLPIAKFIIFSHQMEFSNYYGTSDLRTAYRPWWTKDNAYRWMSMLLEKWGIPPVFAMYNPKAFQGNLTDSLQTLMNQVRAGLAASVPRPEEGDLEFWTPELAEQLQNTFIPAIDLYDKHIARAVLMPTMIGMTPDDNVGSNARSKTHFDGFIMTVTNLQRETEAAIDDQLIKQMVDLNFTVDDYPQFKFNPVDDVRLDLLETWGMLVEKSVVQAGKADEAHIRDVLKMPPAPEGEDELMPKPEPIPVGPGGVPGNDMTGDQQVTEQVQFVESLTAGKWLAMAGEPGVPNRELTQAEQSANVVRLFAVFDDAEADALDELGAVLRGTENRIIRSLRGKTEITPADVEAITSIPNLDSLRGSVADFLKSALEDGDRTATEEIPQVATNAVSTFTPQDALDYLDAKAVTVSATTDQVVVNGVKQTLLNGISQGKSVPAIISDLQNVFEPLTGPQPYRLEAIVRTNYNDAFNAGRLNRFARAGEFLSGVQYSAILDARTTPVCQSLDGLIFEMGSPELDRLRPPRHHMCRSLLVPVLIDQEIDDADRITESQVGDAIEQSGPGF